MSENRLIRLEATIEKQRRCFYTIGKALAQIQHERLYRELFFENFHSYVKTRWDMSKSHAYRLIEASRVIDNLSPIGDVLPENEAQLRPLAAFQPAEQRRIWRAFLDAGLALCAGNIRRFVTQNATSKSPADLTGIISESYRGAVDGLLGEIRKAKEGQWQSTSREAALFWLCVMKENIKG